MWHLRQLRSHRHHHLFRNCRKQCYCRLQNLARTYQRRLLVRRLLYQRHHRYHPHCQQNRCDFRHHHHQLQ
jgi:hypothetical protein